MSKDEAYENFVAVVVLTCLSIVYLYMLSKPDEQQIVPFLHRQFVIPVDTEDNFNKFVASYGQNQAGSISGASDRGERGDDDFYFKPAGFTDKHRTEYEHAPIVPSDKYICSESWVSLRAEANYKYWWVHGNSEKRLSATASQQTPLHLKSFRMSPVHSDCSGGGYITLQAVAEEGEDDANKKFLYMSSNSSDVAKDQWYVQLAAVPPAALREDSRFHFLLEEEGFVLNRGGMSFVNVKFEEDGNLAGGSTNDWDKTLVAGREYGAIVSYSFVNTSEVLSSLETEHREERLAQQQDEEEISLIKAFPPSTERRVISFGLYGTLPKYTLGAVRNAELASVYFPGWVCRFYVTSDVPAAVVARLKELRAEIEHIPDGMGYSAGMFYRFLVAADSNIDRYIIRDADSRLNARDRLAVEDWIQSKKPVHVLRDHVNHCNTINGGMWGGVMGALPNIAEHIMEWSDRDQYLADINFLTSQVWGSVMDNHLAHDSYCCDQFPQTRPFPSRRPPTYQHVGQVFDAEDKPRRTDIEGYIRGVPTPVSCRNNVDWIYGSVK